MNKYQQSLILIATGLSGASCSSVQHSAPQQIVRSVAQVPVSKASIPLTKAALIANHQTNNTAINRYPHAQIQAVRTHNAPRLPRLSSNELRAIGDKIFANESGANKDKLVHWNDNENFASMGIGHWTWYPAGRNARFGNTFPELLTYLEQNGINLPYWLKEAKHRGAPWRSKAEQQQARRTPQIQQLTQILYNTRALQAKFILQRAEQAIPRLVKAAPANQRARVIQNVEALMNTAGGRYALIDYINFKGEGLRMNSGYRGQNWGVLQVLLRMDSSKRGSQVLNEFANAALYVLERRVRNSPQSRNEARWLPGWSNRVNTYRNPWV